MTQYEMTAENMVGAEQHNEGATVVFKNASGELTTGTLMAQRRNNWATIETAEGIVEVKGYLVFYCPATA